MATNTKTLSEEIKQLQLQLNQKASELAELQSKEISTLVDDFLKKVEASGFSKVEVKKMVVEKLTRKNKRTK